jgi:hypothetical protein
VEDPFNENYKTLEQEFEEDSKRWKDSHIHKLEELILFKSPYYPKPSADSMPSSSKCQ